MTLADDKDAIKLVREELIDIFLDLGDEEYLDDFAVGLLSKLDAYVILKKE